MPRVQVPRHIARLVVDYFTLRRLIVDYFAYAVRPGAPARRAARRAARRRLLRLRRASGCPGTSRCLSRHIARLVVDYFTYTVCPGAPAHHAACRRLLRLRRMSRCPGTSRGSSRDSSSTTSPTPRVWVPRHVARLVTRLVLDYVASCRLVVDYAYAARPGAPAHCAPRRRLLRLCRASGCPGTSHGSSHGMSSTTSLTLRVRVPRHVARLVSARRAARRRLLHLAQARRRLLRLVQARRRLIRLLRASGCPGSSRGSSSTTSLTPRVRACRVTRRRLLRLRRASGCLGTVRGSSRGSSSTTSCDAPGFLLVLLMLMIESAESNRLTEVKPRSTWVITSKTSPMNPIEPLDQVYTHP
jgi:hypothetical protein